MGYGEKKKQKTNQSCWMKAHQIYDTNCNASWIMIHPLKENGFSFSSHEHGWLQVA